MKRWIKRIIITLLLVIMGATALTAWLFWGQQEPLPEGLTQANGRIECDHCTVASKIPGKIVELKAREGDYVKEKQILARLDDAQVLAKVDQSKAAVETLEAQLNAARTALSMLKKQVPLQVETAKAGVTLAKAAQTAAKANMAQAGTEARRFQGLLKKNTVSKESTEQKELVWKIAKAESSTAQAAVTQAQKRLAEAELSWQQVAVKEQEMTALKGQVKQVQAALAEAQSIQNDLTIRAPADGIVTTRIVNNGEVIAAGSPLFDVVNLDHLYLKVYIPEIEIGKVRLGLPARIYTDAFPDEPFPATVRYIASRAEFTPKEVQTPDERVKLVYAVKLYLDENPDHRLTPGLPADAVIRWQEDAPWAKPRW